MKKTLSVSILLLFVISLFNINAVTTKKKTVATVSNTAIIAVYYFHFTRRCATCQAVEAESQKAVASLYPAQFKSGKITFKSINLDENDSKTLATKCNVEGQSLLILSGNKRLDLTEQGFMYARSNPDKLKQALKKAIDPLID